jgi:cell filamentation protein
MDLGDIMDRSGRYNTSSMIEDQYEPGSRKQVLKNQPGIKSKREMSRTETRELLNASKVLIETIGQDHRFTKEDISDMHRLWMGNIYEWAGRYRQVTMSKGGFTFASPLYISNLMVEFEQDALSKYTPCRFTLKEDLLHALAIVHVEFLLIHPFREGNGRLARLLSTLMALQAGLPLLDFSDIKGNKKERYFSAVRSGLDRDYLPMAQIFSDVISLTLRSYEKNQK